MAVADGSEPSGAVIAGGRASKYGRCRRTTAMRCASRRNPRFYGICRIAIARAAVHSCGIRLPIIAPAKGAPMQLNRWNYYSDFVVYPAVVLALSGLALHITPVADWWRCGLLFLAGAIAWTLAEYGLHRFVFHRIPGIREMHEAHHHDQRALIGTSTFVSAPGCLAVMLPPLWLIGGSAFAFGLTGGFLLGYLCYVSVHHLVHHRPARPRGISASPPASGIGSSEPRSSCGNEASLRSLRSHRCVTPQRNRRSIRRRADVFPPASVRENSALSRRAATAPCAGHGRPAWRRRAGDRRRR